jgi:ribonuclease T2
MRIVLLWIAAMMMPALAWSQAAAAQMPGAPHVHAELPSADQPPRRVPTTGYTLSLIWTPEHCYATRGHPQDGGDPECTGAAAHGFTLHGLWPDGAGPNLWPQYCQPVALLTDAQIAAGQRDTPSPQLLQHEWAKHGSCMANDPAAYFTLEDRIYEGFHAPDMAMLSHRRGLLVSDFTSAFAAANPGMRADMMRLNLNKNGWLQEVWICLGLDKRPRTCPAGQGGAQPGDTVKVSAP